MACHEWTIDMAPGNTRMTRVALWFFVITLPIGLACEREARRYQELPAAANRETAVRVSPLEPGEAQRNAPVKSPYQGNAWGMGEGKRLYSAYNCAPCHGMN